MAGYLWGEDVAPLDTNGIRPLARYLWDEETIDPDAAGVMLARYLWDKEGELQGQTGVLDSSHQFLRAEQAIPDATDMMLARYLWDEEEVPADPNGVIGKDPLAIYLWNDDRSTGVRGSPQYTDGNDPAKAVEWDASQTYYQIASVGEVALSPQTRDFIIIAKDLTQLKARIEKLGGVVKAELALINGLGVTLTRSQVSALQGDSNVVSIVADQEVRTAGAWANSKSASKNSSKSAEVSKKWSFKKDWSKQKEWLKFEESNRNSSHEAWRNARGERRETYFPGLIDADELHREGVTCRGVGVAGMRIRSKPTRVVASASSPITMRLRTEPRYR